MGYCAAVCLLMMIGVLPGAASDDAVIESTQAPKDLALTSDPAAPFWLGTRPVYADKGLHGEMQAQYRTEIRSRWTDKNLYLLFICSYETLNLKTPAQHVSCPGAVWPSSPDDRNREVKLVAPKELVPAVVAGSHEEIQEGRKDTSTEKLS